jgi:urease accessory protein
MRAHAVVEIERENHRNGDTRMRINRLRSEGALVLRPTREALPTWADCWSIPAAEVVTVRTVAGAAGPLGGDHWRLDVSVGEGATLMLGAVAATLVLPGRHGTMSVSEVNVSVAAGGTLIWRPRAQIAAKDCRHISTTRIDIAADARLFAREEFLLGRHNEAPGDFQQRLRVTQEGKPIYDQQLSVGPAFPGWRSAAVTGGRHALGSILIVDSADESMTPFTSAVAVDCPDTAILQISGQATLISSLANDSVQLQNRLDRAFAPFGSRRP